VQETVTNFWQTQFTYDGFGRRRSRQDYVWQMNQRGQDLSHFEIVPSEEGALTPEEFAAKLNQIQIR
jgi:hypothetical protein